MGHAQCKTAAGTASVILSRKCADCQEKCLTSQHLSCKIAKVITMDEILEQSLLYDFYGELLNEHQKDIYEQYVFEDLSLSEIARESGMSRQGVHDLVKRSRLALEDYEKKLHLVEKFLSIKKKVQEMDELLDDYEKIGKKPEELIQEIRKISDLIIEEL